MNVRTFTEEVPSWLSAALADFEREFTWTLGTATRFRISHGSDYLRFFRSIGECACIVAEKDGRVLGTISGAIQTLALPDGTQKRALYVGDLKITAGARGTRVLLSLARALENWAQPRVQAAYCVVMDGSGATPTTYTGRAGLPAFEEVAHVCVLRIPARALDSDEERKEASRTLASLRDSHGVVPDLPERIRSTPRVIHVGGQPVLRSKNTPAWVVHPDAFGRLEDTSLAKKVLLADGTELESAHLSCFCAESAEAGAQLLSTIARAIALLGLPAFFTAVPTEDTPALVDALRAFDPGAAPTVATATVFATGLPAGVPWAVNTAEI